jgi:glycosyltransferase involved in cell wall biosynthesis
MAEASIIVPVYNEVDTIESTIIHLHETLTGSNIAYEIIIVNDGSMDGTTEKLQGRTDLNIHYIEHKLNRGYGASIKTGIRKAGYKNIVITDADGTYPIDEIPSLIEKLQDFDMVVGQRSFKNLPNKTKPAKWLINRLANYVTETKIPDINSGLRAFRKTSFTPFVPIIPDGFSLTTTITLGMLIGGFDVTFQPIEYYVRKGKSKIKPIRDTYNFLRLIFKIGLFLAPLKIFAPISGFLFFLGIGWGIFSWLDLGKFADSSTIIILVSALQVLLLALIAEIINHRTPNFYKKIEDE